MSKSAQFVNGLRSTASIGRASSLFVAIGLVASAGLSMAAEATNTPPRRFPPPQPISPEVHADRTVTFRVRAPNATNVTVAGEWAGGARPMASDPRGNWSVTLGPLAPELYGYSFSIDGFQTLDPGNPAVKPMRSPRTSILEVPGTPALLHEFNPSVAHGTVREHWYQSKSLGKRRSLHVYTPPGYDRVRKDLPVLYLLHGSGDNDATWTALGRAQVILDNLLAQKKVKPMIVVMTDGHAYVAPPGTSPTNTAVRGRATLAYQDDLLGDVMPFVEANYRTIEKRESRAIIGLSMGGGQALHVGLNHLDRFAWVGAMSAAIPETNAVASVLDNARRTNQKLRLFWIAIGKDDFLLNRNEQFHSLLESKGIRHTYQVTEGNHSWPVWRKYLAEFAPLVFQK
jgi:enterochelin esterase family protein